MINIQKMSDSVIHGFQKQLLGTIVETFGMSNHKIVSELHM